MLNDEYPAPATVLGRRDRLTEAAATGDPNGSAVIRFGPGVPALEPESVAEPVPAAGPAPAPASRRSVTTWLAGAVLVAVLAAILWWWLHRPGALGVTSVRTEAPPATIGCGGTAELRAVVRTDGDPGTIRYRWRRSDGQVSGPLRQTVPDGRRTSTLVLRWRVEGIGRFHGTATVEISAPVRRAASTAFDYRCI